MDFAEIRELDHMLVPAKSCRPQRLVQPATEEDLVNACKSTCNVFHFSPRPSNVKFFIRLDIKEDIEERQKTDEGELFKLAQMAADSETTMVDTTTTKREPEKKVQRTKTQTFREDKALSDYVALPKWDVLPPEKCSEPKKYEWITRILSDILNGICAGSGSPLIADDTSAELLDQHAMFVKLPFANVRSKNSAASKSLLTKLLGSVSSACYRVVIRKKGKGESAARAGAGRPEPTEAEGFPAGIPAVSGDRDLEAESGRRCGSPRHDHLFDVADVQGGAAGVSPRDGRL